MVPTGTRAVPYFWTLDGDRERFERSLDGESGLSEYEAVDELDGKVLYRAEWDSADDTFVHLLTEYDVVLQRASGDVDSWTFLLRFSDSDSVSAFYEACEESGLDVTVERLHRSGEPASPASVMTDAQWRLVEHAYDEGYFDVPRRVTLAELAEQVGVSDQAVNERLRRGLRALVESRVKPPTAPDTRTE